MTPRDLRPQGGLTVVELLVVLVLLGVIGSIVAGGVIRGQRADAQARDRIEAFEDLRIALEQVSREVRAASTPLSHAVLDEVDQHGDEVEWAIGEDIQVGEGIELEVLRDGICIRYTYWVDDADALRVSEERSTDSDCDDFGAPSERILVQRLADRNVFTFETDQYDSGVREEADTVRDIRFVTITLRRNLFEQQPVEVSTVVGLRNAR